jgi:Type VI secretion system effector, Hcp
MLSLDRVEPPEPLKPDPKPLLDFSMNFAWVTFGWPGPPSRALRGLAVRQWRPGTDSPSTGSGATIARQSDLDSSGLRRPPADYRKATVSARGLGFRSTRGSRLAAAGFSNVGGGQQDFVKYTLRDVVISSFETVASGDEGSKPEESITLTFSKVKVEY